MLKNRWIIVKKDKTKSHNAMRFNYTIMPVDGWADDKEYTVLTKNILSKQDLDLGTYTDDELNSEYEHYEYLSTGIATVESTALIECNPSPDIIKLRAFGARFGEFSFMIYNKDMTFKVNRGDTILVRRIYNIIDLIRSHQEKEETYNTPALQETMELDEEKKQMTERIVGPCFRMLYNITTNRKASCFPKAKCTHAKSNFGDCDKVVILGVSPIDLEYDMRKHILVHSKFGYTSLDVDELQSDFWDCIGDKLILQQYYDRNTGEISYRPLANQTIDNMRNYLLQIGKHK